MHRAMTASLELPSASFTLDATMERLSSVLATVVLHAEGRLQDGGRQLHFTANADIEEERDGVLSSSVAAEVIVAGNDEAYIRVMEMKGDALFALFGNGVPPPDTWWSLSPREGVTTPMAVAVTPDPVLLRAQMAVIRLDRDRGIEVIDGRETHVFDVVVDPQRLSSYARGVAYARGQPFDATAFEAMWGTMDARGTLWIDVQTGLINRIHWTLASHEPDGDGLAGDIDVHFFDHGTAQPISPPAAAEPFPWSTDLFLLQQ